jgi:hypothetical protein
VFFLGSSTTTVSASGGESFPYLFVSKTGGAGVTLSNNITVSNRLDLNGGLVNTGTNEVYVSSNSNTAVTSYSTSSYVNGNLRREINTGTYDFPVGTSSYYEFSSLNINSTSGGLTNIIGRFDNYSGGSCSTDPNFTFTTNDPGASPSTIVYKLDAGYWTLTPNSGTANYDITIVSRGHSNGPPMASMCTVIKRADCNSAWGSYGNHYNSTQSGNGTGAISATRTNLSGFSQFDIGFNDAAPLPIELLFFTGRKADSDALLQWATATELNNSYFAVERSRDGINFSEIGSVNGAGTTNIRHDYNFTDRQPLTGVNYYRLRQVDTDGTYSYSNIVSLSFDGDFGVLLYPNPVSNQLHLDLYSQSETDCIISVLDITGRTVVSRQSTLNATYQQEFINTTDWLPGNYIVKVVAGDKSTVIKVSRSSR